MASLPPIPCPRCGYHAPAATCPYCGGEATRPEFRREPGRFPLGIALGLMALPRGLGILLSERGIKRWMVPPLVLTVLVFAATYAWLWGLVSGALAQAVPPEIDVELFGLTWLAGALEWVFAKGWALLAAKATGFLALAVVGSLLWWYAFSLVFEAVAGPFLDEVHGILEERWYGADPRASLERPRGLDGSQVTRYTLLAGAVGALVVFLALHYLDGGWKWLAVPGFALPAAVLGVLVPAYGRWLGWFVRVEGGAARASLFASVATGVLLVLALPLYLVPVVGWWLVGMIAGFATAIGLLDVPFSRRGWGLAQRAKFLRVHAATLALYGFTAGLVFAIPFVGPVMMVPAASVGGLWLFARLDKRAIRTWAEERRGSAKG